MEPLASAIAQKEREVQQYSALRINTLEASAMERDRVLDAERARYLKLKEDFQYNLVLLDDRDRELHELEQKLLSVTSASASAAAEVSRLKLEVARAAEVARVDADARLQQVEHAKRAAEEQLTAVTLSAQRETAALTAEVEGLQSQLGERNAQVSSLSSTIADQQAQIIKYQQEATGFDKWKQALMLQHEAQSSDSLTQLRAAQEALVSLKQQFDARLADVISEKEREAQAALATLQSQLTALDAKYTRSQEAVLQLQRQLRKCDDSAKLEAARYKSQLHAAQTAIKDLKGQLEGSDVSVRSLVSQLDVTRTELEVASGRLTEYQREREAQLQRHSYTVSQSASQEAALRDKVDALSSDNVAMKAELTAARAQNESLREQVGMLYRAAEGDKHRMDALVSKAREGEACAAELATVKHRLAGTEALLKDARTELSVTTTAIGVYEPPAPRRVREGGEGRGYRRSVTGGEHWPTPSFDAYAEPLDPLFSLAAKLDSASARLQALSARHSMAAYTPSPPSPYVAEVDAGRWELPTRLHGHGTAADTQRTTLRERLAGYGFK